MKPSWWTYLLGGVLAVITVSSGIKAWQGYQASNQEMLTTDEARERSTLPKPAEIQTAAIPSALRAAGTFAWSFAPAGEDEATGAPVSRVTLTDKQNGRTYDLGTSLGNCFVAEESSWGLLPGERTAAICYFAGGGDEFGVFEAGTGLAIRKGFVDEGSAEIEGGREGFETVAAID